MFQRTTRLIAEFPEPFTLESIDEVVPAGVYAIEQLEELIESASWRAYLTVAVNIHLPAIGASATIRRVAPISDGELAIASVQTPDGSTS